MNYANLDDIEKINGGTARFTFRDIAYQGIVSRINYVPLGPGAINVELISLQPVTDGPAVPDVPLQFTISFFMAEVTNRPRELIIHQLVPQEGFGAIISFHVRT